VKLAVKRGPASLFLRAQARAGSVGAEWPPGRCRADRVGGAAGVEKPVGAAAGPLSPRCEKEVARWLLRADTRGNSRRPRAKRDTVYVYACKL